MRQGLFITIEGGEGAGKSTLLQAMLEWLQQQQLDGISTREPGGTGLGERIRELLLSGQQDAPVAMCELLLVFAARSQHLEQLILPALADGKVVICDRFTDSSYAYQGAGRELGAATVAQLELLVHAELQPDITFLLDLPAATGRARKATDQPDRIEREATDFFDRVRQGFLERAAAAPDRIVVLDARQPAEMLAEQVIDKLKNAINTIT